MDYMKKEKPVIVQEFVPGKQITLCHIIANPGEVLYTKLGLDPQTDYSRSAIGVLTVIPYESAVIAADISMKSSFHSINIEPHEKDEESSELFMLLPVRIRD